MVIVLNADDVADKLGHSYFAAWNIKLHNHPVKQFVSFLNKLTVQLAIIEEFHLWTLDTKTGNLYSLRRSAQRYLYQPYL